MQIKEVGNKLQLLRAEYVPGDRTRAKMIGSLPKDSESVPADIRELLTTEEVVELMMELNKRTSLRQYEEASKLLTGGFANTVQQAIQGLKWERLVKSLNPDQVEAIWSSLDEMRTAMRKAGLPKSKKKDEEK